MGKAREIPDPLDSMGRRGTWESHRFHQRISPPLPAPIPRLLVCLLHPFQVFSLQNCLNDLFKMHIGLCYSLLKTLCGVSSAWRCRAKFLSMVYHPLSHPPLQPRFSSPSDSNLASRQPQATVPGTSFSLFLEQFSPAPPGLPCQEAAQVSPPESGYKLLSHEFIHLIVF